MQERLPFRVRIAQNAQDLLGAVEIRSSAYAKHVPEVGLALREAEADDHRPDIVLLVAEHKLDKRVIGSVRLQSNALLPLRVQAEAALPDTLTGSRLLEFMRLGVVHGNSGRMVSAALFKAGFEICHASGIDFILAAGRRSVSSMYTSMHFDDVLKGETVALSYANRLPHGIYCLPVNDADRRWRSSNHSLYDFMARTEHPDIAIDFERAYEAFGVAI